MENTFSPKLIAAAFSAIVATLIMPPEALTTIALVLLLFSIQQGIDPKSRIPGLSWHQTNWAFASTFAILAFLTPYSIKYGFLVGIFSLSFSALLTVFTGKAISAGSDIKTSYLIINKMWDNWTYIGIIQLSSVLAAKAYSSVDISSAGLNNLSSAQSTIISQAQILVIIAMVSSVVLMIMIMFALSEKSQKGDQAAE
jgi:hypothetical protein